MARRRGMPASKMNSVLASIPIWGRGLFVFNRGPVAQLGLIRGKRIKQWTFYKRDESTIRRIKTTVFPNV